MGHGYGVIGHRIRNWSRCLVENTVRLGDYGKRDRGKAAGAVDALSFVTEIKVRANMVMLDAKVCSEGSEVGTYLGHCTK